MDQDPQNSETPATIEEPQTPTSPEIPAEPVEIAPTDSAPADSSAPAIPAPPESPTPPSAGQVPTPSSSDLSQPSALRTLLAHAQAKIQSNKQKKLEKLMRFVSEKKSITNDQAQKLLKISDATASRYLLELVRQNKLKRTGTTITARYEPLIGSNGGNEPISSDSH